VLNWLFCHWLTHQCWGWSALHAFGNVACVYRHHRFCCYAELIRSCGFDLDCLRIAILSLARRAQFLVAKVLPAHIGVFFAASHLVQNLVWNTLLKIDNRFAMCSWLFPIIKWQHNCCSFCLAMEQELFPRPLTLSTGFALKRFQVQCWFGFEEKVDQFSCYSSFKQTLQIDRNY